MRHTKNWGPRMYQYDQYDQTIVDERVAQYADQVRRRLSGELSEDEFRPLRLQNGCTSSNTRTCTASRFRTATCAATSCACSRDRARTRPRLRPLLDAHEHPVQLVKLEETPDILRKLASVQDARHPDLGQLHPQHHRRPVRRHRARRDRRSAPVGRNPAPMVDVPPRIRVAAAQVQDRRVGLDGRPRRRADPRHRRVSDEERARRSGRRILAGGGLGRTPIIGTIIREICRGSIC